LVNSGITLDLYISLKRAIAHLIFILADQAGKYLFTPLDSSDFSTIDRNPLLATVITNFVANPAALRTLGTDRQDIADMYRLLDTDSAALRIPSRRSYVLFRHIMALYDHTLLFGNNSQDSTGSPLVVPGNDLDCITFFYM
jgi:hypothetical protein